MGLSTGNGIRTLKCIKSMTRTSSFTPGGAAQWVERRIENPGAIRTRVRFLGAASLFLFSFVFPFLLELRSIADAWNMGIKLVPLPGGVGVGGVGGGVCGWGWGRRRWTAACIHNLYAR